MSEQTAVFKQRVIAACRAHWPSYDRMRPDHQRKWYAKMVDALRAADRVLNFSR